MGKLEAVAVRIEDVKQAHLSVQFEDNAHLDAVWSVLLTYVYETGVIGAVAVLWAGFRFFMQWRATRFRLVFGSITTVWIVGVTLTTSYQQLLPIWLTLGWLTIWSDLCDEVS